MPITVKRMSDGQTLKLDSINPGHRVSEVKKELHAKLAPKFEHGCKLMFGGKVLKSIHRLQHYHVPDNGTIEMNDSKNWSSSSSSSDSDH